MKLRSNAGNEQNESQTGKPRIHNFYKKQSTTAATIASFWLLQLQDLGIFIFTLIVTSGAPFKVLDHAIFDFTVCGMSACSREINLEPVSQKKNFPVISRGSSCYKYVQERSPRFFLHQVTWRSRVTHSLHPMCLGHVIKSFVESSNRMCCAATFSIFLWILFTLICLQWQRYVNSIHFRFLRKFVIYRLELLMDHVYIHELISYGDFVPCGTTGYNIHAPWNCQTVFSGVTSGFYV